MARNVDREGPLQKAIVHYLKLQYPHSLLFSVPNELASKAGGGKSTVQRQKMIRNIQANAKKMGMLPGMADLVMLAGGRFYAFEVKAKGNYQQDNQKAAQARVEANGGVYAVVRSSDDVRAVLKAHPPPDVVSVPMMGSIE